MTTEQTEDTEYLTTGEVAERLGVDPMTVTGRLVKEGMPYHRWGQKTFRYRWPEIEEWFKEHKGRSTLDGGYLSRLQLAAILRVSPQTIQQYVAEGMPVVVGEGQYPKYVLDDVEKWLAERDATMKAKWD